MDNNNPNPNNGTPEKKTIRQRLVALKHRMYAAHPIVHRVDNGMKILGGVATGAVAGWKLRGKYFAKVHGGEMPVEEAPAEEEPTAE